METDRYALSSEDSVYLQRLLRITEGDRQAYYRDTKVTLLKQRKVINKLETERAELLYKVEGCDVRPDDQHVAAYFQTYKDKRRDLQQVRKIVQDQKLEVYNLEREIDKLRASESTSLHRVKIDHMRRSEILENKLETASSCYNKLLCSNGKLRGTIEHLLQQRAVHRKIVKNLGLILSGCKDRMEVLIKEAIENYNSREEHHQKLQTLKGDYALDSRLCKAQLQEAKRSLQLHKQLVEFVSTKSRKRIGVDEVSMLRPSGTQRSSSVTRGEFLPDPCHDYNVEMFNYASELNNKVEDLCCDILGLKAELEDVELAQMQVEVKDSSVMRGLETELVTLKKQLAGANQEVIAFKRKSHKLKLGIDGMLQLVGGGGIGTANVAGDDDDEAVKAVLVKAIKVIEHEVNQLLKARKFLEEQPTSKETVVMSSASMASKRSMAMLGGLQSISRLRHVVDVSTTPPALETEVQDVSEDFYSQERLTKTNADSLVNNSPSSLPIMEKSLGCH